MVTTNFYNSDQAFNCTEVAKQPRVLRSTLTGRHKTQMQLSQACPPRTLPMTGEVTYMIHDSAPYARGYGSVIERYRMRSRPLSVLDKRSLIGASRSSMNIAIR